MSSVSLADPHRNRDPAASLDGELRRVGAGEILEPSVRSREGGPVPHCNASTARDQRAFA